MEQSSLRIPGGGKFIRWVGKRFGYIICLFNSRQCSAGEIYCNSSLFCEVRVATASVNSPPAKLCPPEWGRQLDCSVVSLYVGVLGKQTYQTIVCVVLVMKNKKWNFDFWWLDRISCCRNGSYILMCGSKKAEAVILLSSVVLKRVGSRCLFSPFFLFCLTFSFLFPFPSP